MQGFSLTQEYVPYITETLGNYLFQQGNLSPFPELERNSDNYLTEQRQFDANYAIRNSVPLPLGKEHYDSKPDIIFRNGPALLYGFVPPNSPSMVYH
jgi:hypothetical protein